MQTGFQARKYVFIVLLLGTALLSVFLAFLLYREYSAVARGIVGMILLYLLFFGGRFSINDVPVKAMLSDPQKGKYLLYALIDPLLAFWAAMQIIEMILFFVKR